MAGIDRRSGRVLAGWPHVRQSLAVIFSTLLGARVLRRTFGSNVPLLLGRPLTGGLLLRFMAAVILAVELWEPRFRVVQVSYPAPPNDPDALRGGKLAIKIRGQYRPNALAGDFTPESDQTFSFGA